LLVVFIFSAILLEACSSSASNHPPDTGATVPPEYAGKTNPLDPDAAMAGAEVFKTNCEPCHGSQGHGDGPAGQALDPRPKNLADLQTTVADDYLFWRISDGRPGTAMIAWKGILTEQQIWQTITFIHTLK
jgi:mono/diheme cytochrome c family protein